jgi:valyl-tRNA synthetase
MNLTIDNVELPATDKLSLEDKWILNEFNSLVSSVTSALDRFEVGVALASLYDFTWDVFCDWYIELCKGRLQDKGTTEAKTASSVLIYVLTNILKLLHPYMPFITEEIYQSLPHEDESIMISSYPKFDEKLVYAKEEEKLERIIEAIRAIRARRAEMNIPLSKKAKLFVVTKQKELFEGAEMFFIKLAGVSELVLADGYDDENAVNIVTDAATFYIPMADVIDFDKERARLNAEIEKNNGEIERLVKKLSNENFTSKAPEAVINAERAKLEKYEATKEALLAALAKLG